MQLFCYTCLASLHKAWFYSCVYIHYKKAILVATNGSGVCWEAVHMYAHVSWRECRNIHFYLTTAPQPLPKRTLHTVLSSASSLNFQYLLFSLRSSSSFLRLLPHLLVTSNLPSTFPSITCFRLQSLGKMWPFRLSSFLLFVGYFSTPKLL